MNKSVLRIALLCLVSVQSARAQPEAGWRKFNPAFVGGCYDIYLCQNSDIAVCGPASGMGVARLSSAGREIWFYRLNGDALGRGNSLIETDNGDIVVGGRSNDHFTVVRLTSEGNPVWRRDYGNGGCNAVIELKDGNLVFAGYNSDPTLARLIIAEEDGEPTVDGAYEFHNQPRFWSMRESDNAIVLLGSYDQGNVWLSKVNFNGEQQWTHEYQQNFVLYSSYNGLVTTENGGFALLVTPDFQQGHPGLIRTDSRGDVVWSRSYDNFRIMASPGLVRLPDIGFVIVGGALNGNDSHPFSLFIDSDGQEFYDEVYLPEEDENFAPYTLRSVVKSEDGRLFATGYAIGNEAEQPGALVMYLGQFLSEPVIIRWSPHEMIQNVLLGESIQFIAVAEDNLQREFVYNWMVADSLVNDHDTTHTVTFETPGETAVECRVSIGQATAQVQWHVTVSDLFISAFTPDTLALTLHRGASVDFSLDTIRFTEGDEPDILWTKTNLSNGQVDDAGSETHATIEFPWSGDYEIEGRVSRGESSDAVTWSVVVRGAIRAFVPEADSLLVLPDSVVHFEVVPSAPEDESLEIQWFVDGEIVREGEVALDRAFSTVDNCRRYLVQCVVADSVEIDTVGWVVEVRELGVEDWREGRPGRPALLNLSPNPFNSMLTIRYASGGLETAATRIAVYDVTGREVMMLVDAPPTVSPPRLTGEDATATHGGAAVERRVVWDASPVPAGVYFVRLQAGREVMTKKVVLMR